MKQLYLLIWIVCGHVSLSYATDTLQIAGANDIRIVPYLQEYVDCSCAESAEQVMEKWKSGLFKAMPIAQVVNRGMTNCHHWFALIVRNESPYREDYLWSFYNDGIHFTLYESDSARNGLVREDEQSHYHPLSKRIVPLRVISFPLAMESGETKSLLLKTEVSSSQNLYFPTDISTRSDILIYELELSFLLGRYYGFFFFAIVFNLCMYIVLRKRFYAMMLGYVFSLVAFNMVEYLHDVYLLPDALYAWWVKIPKLVFLGMTLFFNVYVFMSFVRQYTYFPRLSRLMDTMNKIVLLAMCVFLLLSILFDGQPTWLRVFHSSFVVVLLVQTIVLLLNILAAVRANTPYIWHYLLGNSLLFISVFLYLLNVFNILYLPQFVKPGNIIFAFCVESIYLMIVFTVKYKKDFERFAADIATAEERRKQLTMELISVQEQERRRIAQDIHDGIGGTLQGLRLLLSTENLKAKSKIKEMLSEVNTDFRRLINQIAPRDLEDQGLFGAIRASVPIYGTQPAIQVRCIGDDEKLSQDMKVNIFRIYQELITNVLKHGKGVSSIEVEVVIGEHELQLTVRDDGKGGKQNNVSRDSGGRGMQSIHSRTTYYGGDFTISFLDNGCHACVVLPLHLGRGGKR